MYDDCSEEIIDSYFSKKKCQFLGQKYDASCSSFQGQEKYDVEEENLVEE